MSKRAPANPVPPNPSKDCSLCGACLAVCPLFQATGREELSPRAKHFLSSQLEARPDLLSEKPAVELARLCLSCGRCEEVCPRKLSGAEVVSRMRAEHPDFEQWLWRTWIERGGLLWPSLARLGRLLPENLPGERFRSLATRLKAMDERKGLSAWLRVTSWDKPLAGKRATLFSGCTAGRVLEGWRTKAWTLLEKLGAECVGEPDFGCCAATLGHAGLLKAQREARLRNVELWREAGRPLLVTFCATCRHGLKDYAGDETLGFGAWEGLSFAESVTPLSTLLTGLSFEAGEDAPERALFHRPCHEGKDSVDLAFLKQALGSRLWRQSDNQCCGMGGVLQLGAPELSTRAAERCWELHGARPGDQLITGCSGCVLQLRATAPEGVRVGHWLEIIDPR